MARLVVLMLLAASATPAPPVADELRHKVIAHGVAWDKFLREFAGCPVKGIITAESCSPRSGFVDVRAYRRGCETARDLWGLNGKCE